MLSDLSVAPGEGWVHLCDVGLIVDYHVASVGRNSCKIGSFHLLTLSLMIDTRLGV